MSGRAPTLAAVLVLLVGILVVELGLRPVDRGLGVQVPIPGVLIGPIETLRSQPARHVRDPAAATIVAGVAFGRADDVSPRDEEAFLSSGLWHLLAASGQNIALVAGCCVLLARAFGAGRTTGGVLALGAIPMYVLLVGGGASIVRAGIMGVLLLVAWLMGRLPDVRHVLVVAAAGICWAWPGAHRSLGMQLSFACVAVLIAWAAPLTRSIAARGVPTWLAGSCAASILCAGATAPILQLRTGAAPLTGTLANVVAVPIAGAILVIGLAGSIIAAIADGAGVGAVGDVALVPAAQLAALLRQVAHRAAELPAAQATSPLVTVGLPALVAVRVMIERVDRLRRHARGLTCVLTLVGVALVAASSLGRVAPSVVGNIPLRPGELRIASLDIGQGDATLVQLDEAAVLVDTGPPDGRVVDRLRDLGVDAVDGIILTHDSLDHRGGFDSALAALDPRWVARPRHAPGPWRHVERTAPRLVDLCSGDSLRVGEARLRVLHPRCDGTIRPRTGDLHNDGAMVLLVEHGDVRALLPADAEAPVLLDLPLPALDFLRVSHHGSADPSLPQLLDRTAPSVAAISVGEGNDYGHPRAQVLADLDHAGVLVRRTDRDGTVELRSDGRTLWVVE